jgi:hypothetical protein
MTGPEHDILHAISEAVAARPGAPGRAAVLRALELRADELDAMTRSARTVEERAAEAARRRVLLIELETAGLLDRAHRAGSREELRRLSLPVLLGYHDAAGQLLDYLAGDVRRRAIEDAGPRAVRGAPVSLDWFRRRTWQPPPELDPDEWTALGEWLLAGFPVAGQEGEFGSQLGSHWYRVVWRADDGYTPALLDLQRVAGP